MLSKLKNKKMILLLLVVISFLLIYLNVSLGIKNYSFSQIISAISSNLDSKEVLTINQIRIPRSIVGYLVGANLAISGLIIQSITQNRLTSSQILGVNSGVIFVTVLSLIYLPFVTYLGRTVLGIISALLVILIVIKLSKKSSQISIASLPLSGLVIGVFLLSLTQGILLLNEEASETLMFYMIGSFVKSSWESILVLAPMSIICILVTLMLSKILRFIELGHEMALSLGVNINRYVFIFILIVAILSGTSVSVAGPIGFVGIIIPNLIRKFVKNDYKFLVMLTYLSGGILASASDLVSKFITYPYEVPVGLVISFIGVPMFLFVTMDSKLRGN